MTIEIRQLRYAVATADAQSFSRAAAALRVKQSTLSRRVMLLEERLGVKLFERTTRGAEPTENGRVVIEQARRIVTDIDNLQTTARNVSYGLHGRIAVGYCSSLMSGNLIGAAFITRASNIDIVEVYDVATDQWGDLKAPMPTPRSAGAWGVHKGLIYVAGGEQRTSQFQRTFRAVEAYNPANNRWTQLPPMEPRCGRRRRSWTAPRSAPRSALRPRGSRPGRSRTRRRATGCCRKISHGYFYHIIPIR